MDLSTLGKETFVAIPTRLWKSLKPVFISMVDATRFAFVVNTSSMRVGSFDLKHVASLMIFFKPLISMTSLRYLDHVSHKRLIFRSPIMKAKKMFSLSVSCAISLIDLQHCILYLKCGLYKHGNKEINRRLPKGPLNETIAIAALSFEIHKGHYSRYSLVENSHPGAVYLSN